MGGGGSSIQELVLVLMANAHIICVYSTEIIINLETIMVSHNYDSRAGMLTVKRAYIGANRPDLVGTVPSQGGSDMITCGQYR